MDHSSSSSKSRSSRKPDQTPQLSCELCRERKVKCDKNTPCGNCARSGAVCQPIHRKRLPRGRHALPHAPGDEDLKKRISRLEGLVDGLQPGQSSAGSSRSRERDSGAGSSSQGKGKQQQQQQHHQQQQQQQQWAGGYDQTEEAMWAGYGSVSGDNYGIVAYPSPPLSHVAADAIDAPFSAADFDFSGVAPVTSMAAASMMSAAPTDYWSQQQQGGAMVDPATMAAAAGDTMWATGWEEYPEDYDYDYSGSYDDSGAGGYDANMGSGGY